MRDRAEVWCTPTDFDINIIEYRSNLRVEGGEEPTTVFLSLDLYTQLMKQFAPNMRNIGSVGMMSTMSSIMTTAGQLTIQPLKMCRCFCFVGTKEQCDAFIDEGLDPIFWSDQERLRVDKEFENAVLKDANESKLDT